MTIRVGRLVLTIAAVTTGACNTWKAKSGSEPALLILTEVASSNLAGFAARGGTILDAHSFAIWSDTAVRFIGPGGIRTETHCRGKALRPLAVRIIDHSGAAEVFASNEAALLRFQPQGECQLLWRPIAGAGILGAAHTDSGWVLLRGNRDTVRALERYGSDGRVNARWTLSDGESRALVPPSTHISATGSNILLAAGRYPFAWFHWDLVGTKPVPRSSSAFGSDQRSAYSADAYKGWLGLPVVRIADGRFIQTLFDPQTDSRRLILYDSAGRVVKSVSVEAAMGIMAASVRQPVVVALRTTDRIEAVVYSYSTKVVDK
jgi:hypothetical protein